jgi:integrase
VAARKLTAAEVEKTKPRARLYELRDERGLALRVSPSGVKSWSLRYRLPNGARRRISVGSYPAMSLARARDAVALALATVVGGKDPAAEKKVARVVAERQRLDTLARLAERYFDAAAKGRHRAGKARPKRPRTLRLERYYWDRFVAPAFGKRAIRSISRADIQTFIDEHEAPSTARQIKVVFQRLFAYGRWLELTDADPTRLVQVDPHQPRDRVLSDVELRALWKIVSDPMALERLKIGRDRVIAIELCAITLQRRGEVAGIDLAELDLPAKIWTIPANRAKNGRAHVVPLSTDAIALIEEAISLRMIKPEKTEGDPVFPTVRGPTKAIDADNLTRAFIELARAAKIADARLHDLRRTGATAMMSERIGISRFIVSCILNHASDKGDAAAVTAIYDRNAYLPDKRRALSAWAALFGEIVADEAPPFNVVST